MNECLIHHIPRPLTKCLPCNTQHRVVEFNVFDTGEHTKFKNTSSVRH